MTEATAVPVDAPAAPAAAPTPAAPPPSLASMLTPAPAAQADGAQVAGAPPAAEPVVEKKLPGTNATPAEWKAYYELPVPEGVDPAFAETATGWMAEAGLTPEAAQKLATKWNDHAASIQNHQKAEALKAAQDASVAKDAAAKRDDAALSNEWGDDKEKNMGYAQRVATEFFKPIAGDKTAEVLTAIEDKIGFGATMKLMHAIGSKLGEASPRGLGIESAPPKGSHLEAALSQSINKSLRK